MFRKIYYVFAALLLAVVGTACSEYNRILKSTDVDEKYEYAKMYYESGKYMKAATLLGDVVPIYRGTEKAEEALYLYAMSYYMMEDYVSSGEYFARFCNSYPSSERTERCRFLMAVGDYKDSPDPRLDQSTTRRAIKEFDSFLEVYPRSQYADSATVLRMELSDRLCYKEYLSAKLYLNLGSYMGNNYESAVITARNAVNDYPYSKHVEDLSYIIFKARYEAAVNSIDEKKADRLREAYDEYFTFTNDFPASKYTKEVNSDFSHIERLMKKYQD